MKCLDTTFLIDFLRNKEFAVNKSIELNNEPLATTSINLFEVLLGIYRKRESQESKENKVSAFKKLISNFNILYFDTESSFIASKITADLIAKGKEINAMDCLVAGIMISKNCQTIITRDREHFKRIKGIRVEGY